LYFVNRFTSQTKTYTATWILLHRLGLLYKIGFTSQIRFLHHRMKMKKRTLALATLCAFALPGFSQSLSLRECIDYASKSNGTIINANYDVEIAGRKVKETVGGMLPQLDGSGSYTNNLLLSTTLLPGTFVGAAADSMIPVQFGTQHNMSGTLQLSQKLFDPTFFVGLKAAKISEDQARQSLKMSTEQIAYSISVTYFQTLVIGKQLSTLQSTMITSAKQLDMTSLKLENGLAKQIDVDKMRVSYNNLQTQLQQSELNYKQSLNNLKYYMGMPVENTISLADTSLSLDNQLLSALLTDFNVENRTDYQLQKIVVQTYEADKKRNEAGYLPTLNLTASLGTSAMREKFDFFDDSKEWYNSSSLVFSLRVPIFDGLQKHQRIAQSKLNIEKARTKLEQTEQSIKVDLSNYENQYSNAVTNIRNEQENLALAKSVYENTQLSYQQGMATSLELVQAESSWNESMNNYYSKLLNLYIARVNLEQSKGNLMNYINNK
jgi:outer membrane protein TolC